MKIIDFETISQVKAGHILIDDVDQLYEVIEVFKNSVVTAPVLNKEFYACEVHTKESLIGEGWKILAIKV